MHSSEQLRGSGQPYNEQLIGEDQLSSLLQELNWIYGHPKDLNPQEKSIETQLQNQITKIWDELLGQAHNSCLEHAVAEFLASPRKQALDNLEEQLDRLYDLDRYEDLNQHKLSRLEEVHKLACKLEQPIKINNDKQQTKDLPHTLIYWNEVSTLCRR